MLMINKKFRASYDEQSDVLTVYNQNGKVQESVEVAENLIIDLDKEQRIVNLELLEAHEFLHTLNQNISKEILSNLKEVELHFTNYRNYWIISIVFKHENQLFEEKLPAFAKEEYKSPLLA